MTPLGRPREVCEQFEASRFVAPDVRLADIFQKVMCTRSYVTSFGEDF